MLAWNVSISLFLLKYVFHHSGEKKKFPEQNIATPVQNYISV